jgi:membrane protein
MDGSAQGYVATLMLRRILGPLARRWAWVETLLRVQERFDEVHGGFLASAITLAAFTSLFPILLLATAVVGWLAVKNVDVAAIIISRLGLRDAAAKAVTSAIATAARSRRVAGPVGVIGLLSSGLGLVASIQYAFDTVWQVRGRGLKDKLIGLGWLVGAGLLLVASFGLSALINVVPGAAPLTIVAGLVLDIALWLFTLRTLTGVRVPWRAHLPGAVLGAIGLEVLKVVGAVYVPRAVASSSALYGSIGTVFAILAWLFFFGRLAVYAAVLNVVRWEEEHGTVTVEIELPRQPDVIALDATRAGEAKTTVPVGANSR